MAQTHGRSVKSNRGLGKGGKTSSARPASLSGFSTKSGGGLGGKKSSVDVPKDRQPKNMGKAGPKKAGPKYGRDKGSKTY